VNILDLDYGLKESNNDDHFTAFTFLTATHWPGITGGTIASCAWLETGLEVL